MLRKNFDKISTTVELSLKKLSAFFEKHKEINPSEFFRAPYKIYSTEEYFDIKFYTTQKAITVYKIFKQSIDTNKKPDIFLSRDETDSKDLSVEEKTKQNK